MLIKYGINSPGFVKALEDMIKSLDVGPPGMANFTVGETLGFFIGGQGAMQNWWSDVGSQSSACSAMPIAAWRS